MKKVLRLLILWIVFLLQLDATFGQKTEIDSLKNLLSTATSGKQKIELHLEIAKIQSKKDETDNFFQSIKSAENLANSEKLELKLSEIYIEKAYFFVTLDSLAEGQKWIEMAKNALKKHPNTYIEGRIFQLLGILAYYEGDLENGLFNLRLALPKFETVQNLEYLGLTHQLIGAFLNAKSDYSNALDTMLLSLSFFEKSKSTNTNKARLGIATLYGNFGQTEKSIILFRRSLADFKKTGNNEGICNCFVNMSYMFLKNKQLDSTEFYAKSSIPSCEKYVNDPGFLSDAYSYLSQASELRGDFEAMLKWTDKAVENSPKTLVSKANSEFAGNYGRYFLYKNQPKKAVEKFQQCLTFGRESDNIEMISIAYKNLSDAHIKLNQPEKAMFFLQKYIETNDSVYNLDKVQQVAQAEMSIKAREKELQTNLEFAQRDAKSRQQKWFFGSLLLGLLSIGGLVFYNLKQRAEQEKIRLELANLRSQMNPHFIFNCLNSIYKHTQTGDSETAGIYVQKFSKLLRLVLENSQTERISLKKDLDALSIYAEIEGLRFKNKLDFELKIDPEIDQNFVKIPGMLLQPHVENAIWHGLMHRETGGKVTVEITQPTENLIHVVIEDNGVGRQIAAEFESKTATSHKSLGREITENRLKFSGKQAKMTTKMETIDLFDENNNPCGTRVIIEIPV
jgi:two-component sensor histidine kinase